ncbi:MAG: hypothetical protein L6Q77_02725 [Bacteroidetes bacterium]|nr:hypothetical protein [Bacteroidota bacterium]
MKSCQLLFILILFPPAFSVQAQDKVPDSTRKEYFIGSTFFLLGNLSSKNRPDFFQINFGRHLTEQDAVSLELKTWKYAWPLGIPYGSSFEAAEEKFPGYIREIGFSLVYQRFWWKGLYTGLHVMSAWQTFVSGGKKTGDGFQILNTYRLGYHLSFYDDFFFIEPSLAVTHRPYHTPMPASFKVLDDKWSKVFWGEPGLHFGFNFLKSDLAFATPDLDWLSDPGKLLKFLKK